MCSAISPYAEARRPCGRRRSPIIAGEAFESEDFAAAKIAIFLASTIAGALGPSILWPKSEAAISETTPDGSRTQILA